MNQQEQTYNLSEIQDLIRLGILGQNLGLPNFPECDNNPLTMKGKIRTKEVCPKCDSKFSLSNKIGFVCSKCLTFPKKYFVDLYEKGYGRLKVYSDKQGHSLDSHQRAARVLEAIRYEIDQHSFDPSKYISGDLKNFLFERRVCKWYQSKLKEVEKGNLAGSYTRKIKCYIDMYYMPFFKALDVRDIRTYHIDQFYEQLPNKSLKYLKNILSALENFFNNQKRLDYITEKPAFPVITLDQKSPKWIDHRTQQKILKLIPREDSPIFEVLSLQGIRPGEARSLKVKDINFCNSTLVISRTFSDDKIRERVKSKIIKPRLINPDLISLLRTECKDKHPESFVFLNPRTHKPYTKAVLSRVWRRAIKKAGVKITLYEATRHSLASIAASEGAPLQAIQDVLGHADIRTTLKYAHADLNSQKVVFKKRGKIVPLRPQTVPKEESYK